MTKGETANTAEKIKVMREGLEDIGGRDLPVMNFLTRVMNDILTGKNLLAEEKQREENNNNLIVILWLMQERLDKLEGFFEELDTPLLHELEGAAAAHEKAA